MFTDAFSELASSSLGCSFLSSFDHQWGDLYVKDLASVD